MRSKRAGAQTEFLMGNDPLFTDLSEAIVYDRPGVEGGKRRGGGREVSLSLLVVEAKLSSGVDRCCLRCVEREQGKRRRKKEEKKKQERKERKKSLEQHTGKLDSKRGRREFDNSARYRTSSSLSLVYFSRREGWARLGIRSSVFRVRFVCPPFALARYVSVTGRRHSFLPPLELDLPKV